MRPALAVVAARMRAGALPSVLEYDELLRESGCDRAEALALVARYGAAIAAESVPSGEASVLAALRGFSLDR